MGKRIIDIDATSIDEVYLSVFSNQEKHEVTTQDLSNYIFKYKSSSQSFINYNVNKMEHSENVTGNKSTLMVTIPAITTTNQNAVVKASYFIKIYKTLTESELITSITYTNSSVFKLKEIQGDDKEKIDVEIDLSNESNYTVTCIGITEDKEMFSYPSFITAFPPTPVAPVEPASNTGKIILIVIVSIVAVAIVVGLIFIYLTIRKKKVTMSKDIEHTSFAKTDNKDALLGEPVNSLA